MSAGRAGYALLLLFLSNLLNAGDRALLGIVVDPVKADLRLSDTAMSLISGTAFVLFNLLVGLFIARWADRGNRKHILVLGIALWSAATALTGLAQGFVSLALARVLVGVGEATAFPVAISMIADLYVATRQPRAIGVYQSSVFVGLVLGSILAGVLAAAHGWRTMFVICGLAGFALVLLLAATMREPERTAGSTEAARQDRNLLEAMSYLFGVRGFALLSLGTGVSAMLGAVLPTWAPAFLMRNHGVGLASLGALIGPTVGVGGFAGTIAAGFLASRLAQWRGREADGLLVPIVALPLATPFYLIFTFAPTLTLTMAAAAVMNFLLSMGLGPCIAVAVGVAPQRMRAISSTVMLIASGVIGGALAPVLVGLVSDSLAPDVGADALRYGLVAMVPTPLIASVLLWLAYRRIWRGSPAS